MATIGFIGLGNMGGPMARNLIKAGHSLKVFDLSEEAMNFVVQSGAEAAKSAADAATNVDAVVTMLPVGDNVRSVYVDAGVLDAVSEGTLMIESSTIDVETARAMHAAAEAHRARLDLADRIGEVGLAEHEQVDLAHRDVAHLVRHGEM